MASDAQVAEKPAKSGPITSSAARGSVTLENRITIHPDRPVPEFATPQVPAFSADDATAPAEPRLAYICDVEPLPRIETMEKIKALARPGLTQIVTFGPIDWPGTGGQRLAVITNPPQGGRLVPLNSGKFQAMSSEAVLNQVIRPIVTGLTEMFHRNQIHRGIRPDNIFYGDAGRSRVVLGQSVTAPAGYFQTPAFETIEASTADPDGKGFGTRAEDMFSLGATILSLLVGRIPGAGMDPDDLFAARVEKGSMDAYADQREIPRDMVDGLRGLMTDETRERWTLEQFKSWLEGNRVGQPRIVVNPRAHAGFDFGGKKIWSAPSLALQLTRKPDLGIKALRSGDVHEWMKKSLPDNTATDALHAVLAEFEVADTSDSLLLAKASIAMDPSAPIRFGGYNFRIDGMGPMLLAATRRPNGVQIFAEMLRANLPSYWLNNQPKHINRGVGVGAHLEKLGRWVSDSSAGSGIERCLYDLNPNLPCRSPITGGRWVSDPASLLPAIDAAAAAGGLSRQPIDRHIAAFLAARSHADTEQLLGLMQTTDVDEHSALGTLRLLAELQSSFKAQALPGLGNWCAELLKPVIESFHHRKRRAKLLEVVMAVARAGNLQSLLKIIDDPEFKRVDRGGFEKARANYERAENELAEIERNAAKRISDAHRKGREAAALIAAGVAVLTVGVSLMMRWL